MRLFTELRGAKRWGMAIGLAVLMALAGAAPAAAQTTISTGSIQGTVTDQTAAVIAGAKITITNRDTKQELRLETSGVGAYSSGALLPGSYVVRVESKGFQTVELAITVQVGVVATGNVTM